MWPAVEVGPLQGYRASSGMGLGLDEGSTMTATTEGGRLILEPRSVVLQRLRRRFSGVPRSARLADELVADRRAETLREDGN